MTKTKLVSKQRFLRLNFKVRSYFGISVKIRINFEGFWASLGGLGRQDLLQACFWGWVNRFRQLGNSSLRFRRKVTIILVQVTKVRTGGWVTYLMHLSQFLQDLTKYKSNANFAPRSATEACEYSMESSWPPQQSGGHPRVTGSPLHPQKAKKRAAIINSNLTEMPKYQIWANFEIQSKESLLRHKLSVGHPKVAR